MIKTKHPRCAPCTKAKRKCSPSESSLSCEACVKRGLDCQLDTVKIITYKGPRKQRKLSQSLKPLEAESFTTSSLIGMLTDAADAARDHERHADEFLLNLNPKVYLPRQKMSHGTDDQATPMLIDETEERVFDEEVVVPRNFSLNDFVQSSLRVRSIKQQQQVLKAMSLSVSNTKGEQEIGQELQKNGYTLSTHCSKSAQKRSPLFANFTEVKIVIDTENLSKDYFVKESGAQLTKDQQVTIVNFNEDLIPRAVAETLFRQFCELQMKPSESPLAKDRISALQVCLPLVFGNVTVLEAAIILSYYHIQDPELAQYESSIEALHLSIFSEFQVRVQHPSTLCCDHTLLLLLYLMQIEVVKGATIPLYQHLLTITHALITFRGGPKKFTETLTGQCLMELLSPLFINGNHHIHHISASVEHAEDPYMTWNSFQSFLNSTTSLKVYDNIQFTPTCGFPDLRDLIRVYGHINHLQTLLTVAYRANSEILHDGSRAFDGSYEALAGEHLGEILNESVSVDGSIRRALQSSQHSTTNTMLDAIQIRFSLEASLLYLYETVYHDVAMNSRSVLLVKRLLESVKVIFERLRAMDDSQLKEVKIFPLAMFTLGVSIIGNGNRDWYMTQLEELYQRTQRQNLASVIPLLRRVWTLNPLGNSYVDTRQLAAQAGITICLHV